MIGQDVVNAALEGMTLVFETFSRKERKMPRLTIKTSDKNLIKVASFEGRRIAWCSYWKVPAIPKEGIFSVPAGFSFRIARSDESVKNPIVVSDAAGGVGVTIVEGEYLVLVSPNALIPTPEGDERIYRVSAAIFVCNESYFSRWWEPAESNEKSIKELIARGTLIDTETTYQNMAGLHSALESQTPSKVETLNNSVFDSVDSAHAHSEFKKFEHRVVNYRNPSLVDVEVASSLLRGQGRAVIDTLNPSKDDLAFAIKLLMERSYLIYRKGETGFSDLAWMKSLLRAEGYHVMTQEERLHLRDMNYESGYAKGLAEGRRQVSDSNVFATRAYQVGFDAGRMVERLGILKGEENDRTEREHAPESDSRGDRTFPEDGAVTSRLTSRHFEKLARHGAIFRIGTEGFRESESRSRSATQWADSEQPIYADERRPAGEEVPKTHGDSPAERNENEKGDA